MDSDRDFVLTAAKGGIALESAKNTHGKMYLNNKSTTARRYK